MLTFGGLMAGGSTVTGGGSTVTGGGAPGAGDTVTGPGGTTVVSVPGGAVTTVVSLGDVVVVVVVVVSPASSPSLQATNAPVLMAATARTAGDNFLRCVILAPLQDLRSPALRYCPPIAAQTGLYLSDCSINVDNTDTGR
jgi:hypothetical protein